MKQYLQFKAQYPNYVLFFRMGDFYELFENDAETAHKILGLTLTSRDKEMPMAGFPHHQLESYLHKLLREGFRVAAAAGSSRRSESPLPSCKARARRPALRA